MKNVNIHTIPLTAAVCISLLFSCTTTIEFPQQPADANSTSQTWSYCVYLDNQQCYEGSYSACPGGGILSSGCPFEVSESGAEPEYAYCVFATERKCLTGPVRTCPPGGELSNACPYSSSSSLQNGSSSSSSGSNISSSSGRASSSSSVNNSSIPSSPCLASEGPVACYGKLKASGNKLIGSKIGTAVQVRGVSLYWSNTDWGGEKFFTAATVNAMVDDWKAEVIRVPMGASIPGTDQYYGSYAYDKAGNKARVTTAIDAAIAKGVYVIIDWHSHNAHLDVNNSIEFFTEMAQKYGSKDHVIFEIYNEPLDIPWSTIKTYANSIISTIRQYSDNLILVGTPNWDQDVDVAATDPVIDSKNNIAYVFHFYAVEHTRARFESNLNAVLSANLPIFVSEYGTTEPSGDGAHSATNTDAWHTYMDNNKISSCAWNLSDKRESSAFFGVGSFNMSSWTNTSYMTASGQYIFNKLRAYANSASWRGSSTPSSSSGGGGSGSGLYCDYGYPTSWGGGCVLLEDIEDCNLEWGKVVTSCNSRTDMIYCYRSASHCYSRTTTSCDSGDTKVSSCPNSTICTESTCSYDCRDDYGMYGCR